MSAKRNFMAKALASPLFRKRIVAAKRGKGSYSRKNQKGERHGQQDDR